MALPPQKNRELVLQVLFGLDVDPEQKEFFIEFMMKELKVTKKNVQEAFEKAVKILAVCDTLDEKIKGASTSFSFSRIQSVERNIIRLCLYEFLNDPSMSINVLISEAKRLAKKFSNDEATGFVQAILDRIFKEIQAS